MRTPLSLFACLLLSVSSARPNSWASGPPLDKIPSPDDLFAFASDPPYGSSKILPREEFLRFLKDGVIEPDPAAIENASDDSGCAGYFFTRDGTPYHWVLWSRHLLGISMGDRSCLIRLKDSEAKSVPSPMNANEAPPLTKAPQESDLFTFTSNLRPSTGSALPLSEKNLRHFLRDGKSVEPQSLYEIRNIEEAKGIQIAPETLNRAPKWFIDHLNLKPAGGPYSFQDYDLYCEGVLVTRDRHVFFWALLSDTALELTSPSGETGILLLPKSSPIEPL
jgi:hypothetical protein